MSHSDTFYINVLIIVLFIFVTFFHFRSKEKGHKTLGLLSIPLIGHLIFNIFNIKGITFYFPEIIPIDLILGLIFPILVLKHTRSLTRNPGIPKSILFMLVVGTIVAIFTYIKSILLASDPFEFINSVVETQPQNEYLVVIALIQITDILCIYFIYQEYNKYKIEIENNSSDNENSLIGYLGIFLTFCIATMSLAVLFILLFPTYLAHQLLLPTNFFLFIIGTSIAYGQIPSSSWKGHNRILNEIDELMQPRTLNNSSNSVEELIVLKFTENKMFTKQSITLYEVAGLSSREFSVYLREKHDMNFFEFVNSYRIKEAKRKIDHGHATGLTLEAIGKEAGFNSRTSFYRAFLKHEKVSPRQYLSRLEKVN